MDSSKALEPEEANAEASPSAPSTLSRVRAFFCQPLSRVQMIVGICSSMITLGGGLASVVGVNRALAPNQGEIVAIVQEVRSQIPVTDAVVEIQTSDDVLVTTLSPGLDGSARQRVKGGRYRLRVTHPYFGQQIKEVLVQSGQTAVVRVPLTLRSAPSTPAATPSTVTDSASAVEPPKSTVSAPTVSAPTASKPVASKVTTSKPIMSKPVASKSITSKSITAKSITAKPTTSGPTKARSSPPRASGARATPRSAPVAGQGP